jgi:hypothetical protein
MSRTGVATPVAAWSLSKLFDYLVENLGIGDFAGEPYEYGPWRVKQIGHMKRIMKYRGATVADMKTCADYCKAHRIQPETPTGLLYHVDAAQRWSRSRREMDLAKTFQDVVAVEQERALSDPEAARWVDKLLRVSQSRREEVLAEWRQKRGE